MLRKFHSKKAQQIVDQVMELAQRYGSDLESAESEEVEPKQKNKKNGPEEAPESVYKPVGGFGSFTGNQVGQ